MKMIQTVFIGKEKHHNTKSKIKAVANMYMKCGALQEQSAF